MSTAIEMEVENEPYYSFLYTYVKHRKTNNQN